MKKYLYYISIVLLIFSVSCKKDDDQGNVPPTSVTNIDVEVIEGTRVSINWEPSTDPNNDEVSYDVIVNDKIVASKTTDVYIEFDTSEFIQTINTLENQATRSKKIPENKASSLELVIKITAYDQNSGVSDEVEVKRNVFVNRAPSNFEILRVDFDNSDNSGIQIDWMPASDIDGDILTYSLYLNDVPMVEDYVLNSDNEIGTYYFDQSFYEYINGDMTIRIIANDRFGGIAEISETYNFRATDTDLGELSIPYDATIDFSITEEEQDARIGYAFEITETTGYFFNVDSNIYLTLFDAEGNSISSNFGTLVDNELSAGTYYLEISNYYDQEGVISGLLYFSLDEYTTTDVNMGTLTLPFSADYFYTTLNDLDGRVRYNFTITEQGIYTFEITSADYDTYLFLYDNLGNFIGSNDDGGVDLLSKMTGTLNSGSYYVEVSGYGGSRGTGTFSFDIER